MIGALNLLTIRLSTMNITTEFFSKLLESVTGWLSGMVEAFQGIVPIFWDDVAGNFTIFGLLLLISIGIGLIRLAFGFIQNLLR